MSEVLNLIEFYKAVQAKLLEAINKLPNAGKEHSCDQKNPVRLPFETNFMEICTNCGGKI